MYKSYPYHKPYWKGRTEDGQIKRIFAVIGPIKVPKEQFSYLRLRDKNGLLLKDINGKQLYSRVLLYPVLRDKNGLLLKDINGKQLCSLIHY